MSQRDRVSLDLMAPDLDSAPAKASPTPDWMKGALDLMAKLEVHFGKLAEHEDGKARERGMLNQVISPLPIPPGVATATAAGALLIASAELFGPRVGWVWDVRRVTVSGTQGSIATSDVTYLYKVSTPTQASAVGNNLVNTFIPPSTGNQPPTYQPGLGACLVLPGQSLMISSQLNGTGTVTGSEQFIVNWDGIQIQQDWLGAYLL